MLRRSPSLIVVNSASFLPQCPVHYLTTNEKPPLTHSPQNLPSPPPLNPLSPPLQLKLKPRLLHRAQIRHISLHTRQPFPHLRPLLPLRDQPELEHELDREAHHRVGGRHGAANEVAPVVGGEVGVEVVEVVAGVGGEGRVVGGGGGERGAADVEGYEAVLWGVGVLVDVDVDVL